MPPFTLTGRHTHFAKIFTAEHALEMFDSFKIFEASSLNPIHFNKF